MEGELFINRSRVDLAGYELRTYEDGSHRLFFHDEEVREPWQYKAHWVGATTRPEWQIKHIFVPNCPVI